MKPRKPWVHIGTPVFLGAISERSLRTLKQYEAKNIKNIAIVHLDQKDVVRHPLVRNIIKAFERYENRRKNTIV